MANPEGKLLTFLSEALTSSAKLTVLDQRTGIRFEDDGRTRELDAALSLRMPDGQQLQLAVEANRTAYPRDVRMAAELLRAYVNGRAAATSHLPVLPLVAAEYLSEGSRKDLRKAGINYFDASGTLYFHHGTWLVDIERPAKNPPARRIGSIFTGAREQVVHAMLKHWHDTVGAEFVSGAELAQMAKTSAYTVSKTMQGLEQQDWVQTTGSGPTQRRRLCQPAALLDAWAAVWKARSEPRSRWYGFAPGDIAGAISEGLADQPGWAITGAAAANMLVPHLTRIDRAVVIVPPGTSDDLAGKLKLQRVDTGANVLLVERAGASLLFADELRDHPGLRLASPFVQYLDLLDGVGRNKELAAEFRKRYLKIEESDA